MIELPLLLEPTQTREMFGSRLGPMIVHRSFGDGEYDNDGAFALADLIEPELYDALDDAIKVNGRKAALIRIWSDSDDEDIEIAMVGWAYGGGMGRLVYHGTVNTGCAMPENTHPIDPALSDTTDWYEMDKEATTTYTVGQKGVSVYPEADEQVDDYQADFLVDLRGFAYFHVFVVGGAGSKLVGFQPVE